MTKYLYISIYWVGTCLWNKTDWLVAPGNLLRHSRPTDTKAHGSYHGGVHPKITFRLKDYLVDDGSKKKTAVWKVVTTGKYTEKGTWICFLANLLADLKLSLNYVKLGFKSVMHYIEKTYCNIKGNCGTYLELCNQFLLMAKINVYRLPTHNMLLIPLLF